MTPTLYAAFLDAGNAETAAVALLERGVRPQDISLVVNESERDKRETGASSTEDFEELNPAQDDYPRTEQVTSDQLSSAPANAIRMYNTGLETKEYNHGYVREVERENEREQVRSNPATAAESSEIDLSGTERPPIDLEDAGITRPTIPSVTATVAASAGLGLGVGALAALAAISVPGVGLVLGGGALATAVAGLAASSATGTSAEGIVGYLKDQGVPADAIPRLRAAYEHGGAILGVNLDRSPADAVELESMLHSYGADQVGSYGYAA